MFLLFSTFILLDCFYTPLYFAVLVLYLSSFFSFDYFFVSCPWVYRLNNDFEFIVSCDMCRELRLTYTAGNYEWKWKTYYLLHSAYLNRLNNEEVNDIKYRSCFTQHLLLLSSSKQITESLRENSATSSCRSSITSLNFPDKVSPRTVVFLNFYAPSGWCCFLV